MMLNKKMRQRLLTPIAFMIAWVEWLGLLIDAYGRKQIYIPDHQLGYRDTIIACLVLVVLLLYFPILKIIGYLGLWDDVLVRE